MRGFGPRIPPFAIVCIAALCVDVAAARPQPTERRKPVVVPIERQLMRALRQLPPVEAVPEPLACGERLARLAKYVPVPPSAGASACGAIDLVRLDRIADGTGRFISVEPKPILRCAMAEAVAELVRDDVAPAAAEIGARVKAVATLGAYDCRSRNSVAGAKPSEHGRGNALDIGAIQLADGRTVGLAARIAPKPFREHVRDAACRRFSTVLGPGADAFHEDHIHLDLAERRNGHRICQWDVHEAVVVQAAQVPLPRPAPLRQAAGTSRTFRR